ncbi:GAF domain-containing protein [Streptomyces sp. NPDC005863]|uniref:GAF domain-containing protein n=2 Tax=unclassified Streptomyces TaxID=2593676 RepID=UPI00368B77E9
MTEMPDGTDAPPSAMQPLLDAVLDVGTELELRATLQHIVDSAARLTGAGLGTLGVDAPGLDGPAELFVAGGPARHPEGVPTVSPAATADGTALRVPIEVHDEPFGTLLLAHKERGGTFTDEDQQLLRVLASQAGIAIGNARLFEAARQRERWIEGAAAVTTALLTGEAAADALMTVADRARILAGAAAGVILQPTEAGGMRIVAAATDGAPHGWGTSARAAGPERNVWAPAPGDRPPGPARPTPAAQARVDHPPSPGATDRGTPRPPEPAMGTAAPAESAPPPTTPPMEPTSPTAPPAEPRRGRPTTATPPASGSPDRRNPAAATPAHTPTPTRDPYPPTHNDLIGTTIEPGSAVLEQLLGGEPVFIEDSATDARMTTHVRVRFGPSMMLPLQAGGRLIGTLALPRRRGAPAYTPAERLLATQFASQAALALVLADAQQSRERLAVFEDRDRIARDLHDLVVQRLFATGMMLDATRNRARSTTVESTLDHAVDELESTIQEVRTAIFALQQPPADAPATFRGKVLRETAGASAVLGIRPSVHFAGAVDHRVTEPTAGHLLAALRRALAAASRRTGVTRVDVAIDAKATLPDSREGVRLTVYDDGDTDGVEAGTTVTWQAPL